MPSCSVRWSALNLRDGGSTDSLHVVSGSSQSIEESKSATVIGDRNILTLSMNCQ